MNVCDLNAVMCKVSQGVKGGVVRHSVTGLLIVWKGRETEIVSCCHRHRSGGASQIEP